MNVLLIYPEFPDTFWSFKHALKFVRRKAAVPPLGLLTVAAMLPSQWPKRLVDANVRELDDEHLAWADYAFISSMAVQAHAARRIVARCRRVGVKVVAGGPLFTIAHELFEKRAAGVEVVEGGPLFAAARDLLEEVDHLVLGEAEASLPPFLADLQQGRAKRVYTASGLPDLSQSPVPLWELADLDQYDAMAVQFSRGCPHDCDFCNVTALFGHRPRLKTAEQITAELEGLYERGWRRQVFVVDDNLLANKGYLKAEILPALIEWQGRGRRIPFITQVTIELADDEGLMQRMAEAGFNTVFVGIETPDEESLTECGKTQNVGRDLAEDVRSIQRAGLQVYGGFIVGFDHDTPATFQRQAALIEESAIVTAMVGVLQAPPGTRLFDRLERTGRLLGHSSGDNVDGTTNIVPAMGAEALRDGYVRLLQHIYAPEHYYPRIRSFLRECGRPKIGRPVGFREVMAFVRSVFRLGVLGNERTHYWGLLLWTCCHRPSLFPLAVTLAIYGHHFRRVVEQLAPWPQDL